MDSMGASGMSAFSDPKTQIMRQVQQESAMQNARMLVEVCRVPIASLFSPSSRSSSALRSPYLNPDITYKTHDVHMSQTTIFDIQDES
jgi:hypothetical protein